MLDSKTLMKIVNQQMDVGKARLSNDTITLGVVVDGDDPLQSGRLRIFCPNLNDDPKKLHHLPWAACASPFAGTISNPNFVRGAGKGPETTDGPVSYGLWAIPEQGAIVLVARIDGDERRRVWLGCLHSHQETHTLLNGRYDWEPGGNVKGPLSSTKGEIEPYSTNAKKAFDDKTDSAEWKTRQADFQAAAVPKSEGAPVPEREDYLDVENSDMQDAEQDDWVKSILGAHGYDWSANKGLGSFLQSKVYGFSTPGFHAFSMDDRAFSNRMRMRSATGHQIILDDTNERIYIASNEGNNYIELDSNGNIDVYSKRRVSIHAEEDINFSTDKTFRVKAKEGIFMYSGDTPDKENYLDKDKPEPGEIRLHSTADTHIFSEKNLRTLVKEDFLTEVAGKSCLTIGEDMFVQVENDVNVITNDGDYNVSVTGDYNHHASNDTSIFSGNDNKMQAVNDTEVYSYTGKMDVGSQLDLSMKSYTANISVEAIEKSIRMQSNNAENQLSMNPDGLTVFSYNGTSMMSRTALDIVNGPDLNVDPATGNILKGGSSLSGCLFDNGLMNIRFDDVSADFGVPEDIKFKIPTKGITQSIENINNTFNTINDKWNVALRSVYDSLNELSGLNSFPLNFTVPTIGLPPLSVSSAIPSLDLPNFNFNFCVDFSNLINVESFNPLPNGSFIDINSNLGSWTKNSIGQWANRQRSNFESAVNNFEQALDIDTAIQSEIVGIQTNVNIIRNSLDNLINVSLTNNISYHNDYLNGIEGLSTAIEAYNVVLATNPTYAGISQLAVLANESFDHERTILDINSLVQNDGTFNSETFSELSDTKAVYDEFSNNITGVLP